jgi:hypothetical protein
MQGLQRDRCDVRSCARGEVEGAGIRCLLRDLSKGLSLRPRFWPTEYFLLPRCTCVMFRL